MLPALDMIALCVAQRGPLGAVEVGLIQRAGAYHLAHMLELTVGVGHRALGRRDCLADAAQLRDQAHRAVTRRRRQPHPPGRLAIGVGQAGQVRGALGRGRAAPRKAVARLTLTLRAGYKFPPAACHREIRAGARTRPLRKMTDQ